MNFRLPRPSDLDRLFRRHRLERQLARCLPSGSAGFERVILARAPDNGFAWRFELRKDRRRLVLAFDYRRILANDDHFRTYRTRAGVLIDLFARTNPAVRAATVEVSDGSASGDGIVSFCSGYPRAILVPDSEFYRSAGYASFRDGGVAGIPWARRDSVLVWRGSTTGKGRIATDDMRESDSRLIQRTRLCLAVRGLPGVDVKLSNLVQSQDHAADLARLEAAGILGEPQSPPSWGGRKFALDVDGNSNAWTNLFTRLLLGCCVLKVQSARGYRQWYYDELRPFEHFVPVAADLSDVREKIEWCRAHESECEGIAAAGAAFARGRTFPGEMAAAVERLDHGLAG